MMIKTVLMSGAAAAVLMTAAPLAQAASHTMTTKDRSDAMVSGHYLVSADEVIGQDVFDAKGNVIAEIDDVLVTKGKRSVIAVLSVGGFMGIDDKLVAVPYDSLKVMDKGFTAAALTKQKLEKMAAVNYGDDANSLLSHHRYVARMERLMNKWSDKIDQAYNTSASTAQSGAHAVSKDTLHAWKQAEVKFRMLKAASNNAWDNTKQAFEGALSDLNKHWEQATG